MKSNKEIVILDAFTLNPGDLSWSQLEQLGKCTIYDRTDEAQIVQRAQHAEIVLTNKTVLSRKTLSKLPLLEYIGVLATGYNVVDLQYTNQNDICVTNIPGYSGSSVPQTVFSLLLHLTNNVAGYSNSVKTGEWTKSLDFCYYTTSLTELSGKTMGIIGFGFIGRQTAKIAQSFGMKVIVHTRSAPENLSEDIAHVSLDELITQSDVISLHCPLTEDNYQFINKRQLQAMKQDCILINTSRGPLIDEHALADALRVGDIKAAALDVLSTEPPSPDNPLIGLENCIITPHVAWATKAARKRLLAICINNISHFLSGHPINTVK